MMPDRRGKTQVLYYNACMCKNVKVYNACKGLCGVYVRAMC